VVFAVLSALDAVTWRYESQVVVAANVTPSQASKLLRMLEDAGLVESSAETSGEARSNFVQSPWQRRRFGLGGPRAPRRYFRLTPAGSRRLAERTQGC